LSPIDLRSTIYLFSLMPQSFKAVITEIFVDTPRVKTFRLSYPDTVKFDFIPGQYVIISLDGFTTQGGMLVKRSYSIASSPLEKGYLDLCITIVHEMGMSGHMHRTKVGDQVIVLGPFGQFTLKEPISDNLTFISAGSGVAPMRGMVHYVYEKYPNWDKNVWFFFGFRIPEDYIFQKELELLTKEKPNFHLIPSLSTVDPVPWEGDRGRIQTILHKYITNAKDRDYYLCGPPAMVSDTVAMLKSMGAEESRIYKEQW
jgi:Na+-transporting NADH:ubiquinone oxidoreductase subunit F